MQDRLLIFMELFVVKLVALVSIGFWSLSPIGAEASNSFGASCAACHASAFQDGAIRPGAMEVLGEGLLNIDSSRNDSIDRGAIPFFTALRGETVALNMQVVDARARYAVSIDNFEASSVTGAGTDSLTGYLADPNWFNYASSPPNFFINVNNPPAAISWPLGQATPIPYAFHMTIAPTTPISTYELEFTLAGTDFGTPRLFVDNQFFYLQVVAAGDFDSSGLVDGRDFLRWQKGESHRGALHRLDLADWKAIYGAAESFATSSHAVPEPTSALLLGLSLIAADWQSRRRSRRSCDLACHA